MNRLILCEGKTDAILLGYYLMKTNGWELERKPPPIRDSEKTVFYGGSISNHGFPGVLPTLRHQRRCIGNQLSSVFLKVNNQIVQSYIAAVFNVFRQIPNQ